MTSDIVVIGAGAIGLSTALHLARLGRAVTVVERDTAGARASGRAAGLFKSVQAAGLRTLLARRSIALALEFPAWAGAPLEVVRSGSFLIGRTREHQAYLRAEAAQSAGWGVDIEAASASELARRVSYYRASGRELALWCPEDVYIEEPMSLVTALAAACRGRGVELAEHEPVTAVELTSGRVAAVRTSRRELPAATVVDAAGAWTRQVAELAGTTVSLAPVRHQLLITAPDAALDPGQPIVRVVDAAVYLRPARGGLMLGGFEADPLPLDPRTLPAGPPTGDVPLDEAVLDKMAAAVCAEAPLASARPVVDLRGGLFTMSPDGAFVTGPVPDVPGLWVASGCNGSGFSSSLALGEALAAWITDAPGRLNISALSPARFGPITDEALVAAGTWQYAHYYDPASVRESDRVGRRD
jgi:glycine/D-amino acid oxidase-like deaminating enzyme